MGQTSSRSVIGAVAAVCGAVSALLPLSYDEAYWLGIWRMWSGGDVLYVTAIDNKSPLVYVVYGLLDALPGSFQLVRGLFVGLIIYSIGRLSESSRGQQQNTFLVGTLLVVIALLSEFKLYTELMAAPLIVAAIQSARSDRVGRGGVLAVLAMTFTPLAAGAAIVVAVVGWRGLRATTVSLLPAVTLAVGLGLMVGLVDDLRFGLVEMNLASRQSLGSLTPAGQAERPFIVAIAALPIAVFGYLRRWSRRSWFLALLLGSPPLVAGAFLHYWVVPTSGALEIGAESGAPETRRRDRLLVWAALPLVILSVLLLVDYARTAYRYERVTARLAELESEQWDFVQFDLQPYVATRFPDRALLRSPSINYLVWETSRSELHRSELPNLLAEAEVLLEPGLEDDLEVPASVSHLVGPFLDAIPGFDCSFEVEHLTLHLRHPLCDVWERSIS